MTRYTGMFCWLMMGRPTLLDQWMCHFCWLFPNMSQLPRRLTPRTKPLPPSSENEKLQSLLLHLGAINRGATWVKRKLQYWAPLVPELQMSEVRQFQRSLLKFAPGFPLILELKKRFAPKTSLPTELQEARQLTSLLGLNHPRVNTSSALALLL